MLNRRSHLIVFRPYIWASLRLKPFTGHGLVVLTVRNMSHSPLPFMLHVRRLMSTMGKMGYFKKHWSADLYEDVLKCVEEEVRTQASSIPICANRS